jgi:hypothetical protein
MKGNVLGKTLSNGSMFRVGALIAALIVAIPVMAEDGVVYISPLETTELVDETFQVTLEVDENVLGLKGYTIDLVYDSDLLQLDMVEEGALLPSAGQTYFWWGTRGSDTVQVDAAIFTDGCTVDGPGELAVLHFTGLDIGETPVAVENSELRDVLNQSIVHSNEDGIVTLTREGNSCDNPIVIDAVPFNQDSNTCVYTNEIDLDSTDCTGHTTSGPDVVYSFTPTGAGGWGFFVSVPFGYWNISLYVLSSCDPVVCEAGSDEYEAGSGEVVVTDMEENTTYYIVVDGRDPTDCGDYNFGMTFIGAMEDDRPVPQDPTRLSVVPSVGRGAMDVRFEIERGTRAEVRVFNRVGCLVRTLFSSSVDPGAHSIVWNTRDDEGQLVPHGTYFIQLQTDETISMRAVSVLR